MKDKLIYIAGPCVIDDPLITHDIAHMLSTLVKKLDVHFAFKASFDKANRTKGDSFRGVGLEEGLKTLKKIKEEFGIKVLTDVHEVAHVQSVADVVDILQIPAFLCRQTDLITEAAKTGKTINIKKGQFIAPRDMKYIIEKIEAQGNTNIMLTERGTCFGYNDLVVDMRSILIMKEFGYPVIFDATHSVQTPSKGGISGGTPEYIIPLAHAAIACGADGLFTEVYPNPKRAKCDGENSLYISQVEKLIKNLTRIRNVSTL